jgi:hypothetical protein
MIWQDSCLKIGSGSGFTKTATSRYPAGEHPQARSHFDQILIHGGELSDDFASVVGRRPSRPSKTKNPGRTGRPGIFESKQANVDQYSQTLTVRRR